MKEKTLKDIAYHTAEYKKEVERCDDHNKWYDDFIKSLDGN